MKEDTRDAPQENPTPSGGGGPGTAPDSGGSSSDSSSGDNKMKSSSDQNDNDSNNDSKETGDEDPMGGQTEKDYNPKSAKGKASPSPLLMPLWYTLVCP